MIRPSRPASRRNRSVRRSPAVEPMEPMGMVSTLLLSSMPDRSASPAQVPTGEIDRPFIASPLLRGQPTEGKIDAMLREPRDEEDAPARLAITPLAATPPDDVMPVALDWLEFADESELVPLTPMSYLPGGAAGYVPGGPAETVAVGGLDAPAPGDAAFGTIEPLRAPTPVELGAWATASASFLSGLDEDPEIVPLSGGGTPTVWADQSVDGAAAETLPGENEDWAYVLINRFSSPSSGGTQYPALSVRVLIGGTATIGVDYTTVPALSADASGYANLTIPAGVTSYGVEIHPIDDTLWEGPETVIVSVASGTGYNASGGAVTAGIADNERLDLDIQGKSETEEDTPGGLVVKRADGNDPPVGGGSLRRQITIQHLDGLTTDVTLTRNNAKLKVFPNQYSSNEIAFDGVHNKFAANTLPLTLYVEGAIESDAMRDITLTVSSPGVPGDSVAFTVLWVDRPTIRAQGQVSADNDKRDNYKAATLDDTYDLGLIKFNALVGSVYGYAYEAKGVVHPSNFDYPGVDLRLDRDAEYNEFLGLNGDQAGDTMRFNDIIPPGNDPSMDEYRDDTPQDSNPPGSIYDLDAPGPRMTNHVQNYIKRVRYNFREFAKVTIDGTQLRCSPVKSFYIRVSMKQTVAPNGNVWTLVNDVPNDNQLGDGATALTWDLQ